MQQTQTYKLNLLESTDPFSPAPLNENAQKADAQFAALHAAVAAADARHCIDKLLTVTPQEGKQDADIDLSGIDLSNYSILFLSYAIDQAYGQCHLELNKQQLAVLLAGDGYLNGGGISILFPGFGRVYSLSVFHGTSKAGHIYPSYREIEWEDLTTVQVTNFQNRSRLVIYGLRR